MRCISIFLLLLCSIAAQAQNWLPLATGNQWTYRARGGTDSFTIQVGAPVSIGNQIYYSLKGYATQTLPVRFTDANTLVYYDTSRGQEFLLTSFESLRGIGWFFAPFRICDPETGGQGQPERDPFQGPVGDFDQSLKILYQTITCADAGLLNETYVSGIGMVQQTVNTFAGPRVYNLVDARIGKMTLQADPGASFRVTVAQQPNAAPLMAHLDLAVTSELGVQLHHVTSQNFDVVIRTPDGTVVWQWSDGKVFAQSIHDETTFGQSWSVDVPMTDRAGNPLPTGTYLLETWLVTGYERPQFVTSVNVQVPAISVPVAN